MGIKIFIKAVRLVLENFVAALRISLLPFLISTILAVGATYLIVQSVTTVSKEQAILTIRIVQLAVGLINLLGIVWIAVAWHRFILLDEQPGDFLPPFHGGRVLAYVGYTFLLGLVALPFALVFVLLAQVSRPAGPVAAALGGLVLVFAYLVVVYRLGVILVASAVGRRLRLTEAWKATSGATGTFVVLAVISAVAAVVLQLPAVVMTDGLELLGLVWRLVASLVEIVVGISVLTTLYGYFVEHRSVD